MADRSLIATMGRAAPDYERTGPAVFAPIAERLVALVGIPQRGVILDVGTGPGTVLTTIARQTTRPMRFVGVDLSEGMLAEAAIRTSSLKRAGHQVTLRRADAQDLPFDDTTFDAVLCASALYQLPDPGAACHEFYRVLRPGGAAGIAIFGTPDPRWDSKNELVARLAPPIPSAGARIDERKLRELLAAAGFVDINITLDALDVVYETADAWLRQAWNHGERRALEAMDDSAIRELQRELPTALESAREDDGMIHWRPQVLLARARKP